MRLKDPTFVAEILRRAKMLREEMVSQVDGIHTQRSLAQLTIDFSVRVADDVLLERGVDGLTQRGVVAQAVRDFRPRRVIHGLETFAAQRTTAVGGHRPVHQIPSAFAEVLPQANQVQPRLNRATTYSR